MFKRKRLQAIHDDIKAKEAELDELYAKYNYYVKLAQRLKEQSEIESDPELIKIFATESTIAYEFARKYCHLAKDAHIALDEKRQLLSQI